jgi:hypothetical protein
MPFFSPVSAGGVPKATVTGTTGSPTIDTSSRAGKTIYKFTGSGTITIGTAGTCEYLVIGGGAVNGAGGLIYNTSAVLPAGTLTVTIGAGVGAFSTSGGSSNPSQIGNVVALGGGIVDANTQSGTVPFSGGSAGGSRVTSTTRAAALSGSQGNNGGQGTTGFMGPAANGGGGGAGGVGGNTSGFTGGNGGAGSANSITGSSVTYAAGGGGYGQTANGTPTGNGAANTGNGGSSTGDGSSTNTGGSGFVVVVIG